MAVSLYLEEETQGGWKTNGNLFNTPFCSLTERLPNHTILEIHHPRQASNLVYGSVKVCLVVQEYSSTFNKTLLATIILRVKDQNLYVVFDGKAMVK